METGTTGHLDDAAATGKDHGARDIPRYVFLYIFLFFFCFTNNNKTAVWLETGNSHPNLQTPDMQFIGNADASLTVIIFRKFQLSSKSLIITCQDATNTRPDAFTSKHVCEEGSDDKNETRTRRFGP